MNQNVDFESWTSEALEVWAGKMSPENLDDSPGFEALASHPNVTRKALEQGILRFEAAFRSLRIEWKKTWLCPKPLTQFLDEHGDDLIRAIERALLNPAFDDRTVLSFALTQSGPHRLGPLRTAAIASAFRRGLLASSERSQLLQDPEPVIRAAAVRSTQLTHEEEELIAADPDPRPRAAVAGRTDISTERLTQLATDKETVVRLAVAGNPAATDRIRIALAQDPKFQVRRAAVRGMERADLAAAFVVDSDPVLKLDLRGRKALVNDGNLTPAIMAALAEDESEQVRALLVRRGLPDESLLRDLAFDPNPGVRVAVARSKESTFEILELLAADERLNVRKAAATNKKASKELRERVNALLSDVRFAELFSFDTDD